MNSGGIQFDTERSAGGWLITDPSLAVDYDAAKELPLRIAGEDGRELVRVEQDGTVVYESVADLEEALRLLPQVWTTWKPPLLKDTP